MNVTDTRTPSGTGKIVKRNERQIFNRVAGIKFWPVYNASPNILVTWQCFTSLALCRLVINGIKLLDIDKS